MADKSEAEKEVTAILTEWQNRSMKVKELKDGVEAEYNKICANYSEHVNIICSSWQGEAASEYIEKQNKNLLAMKDSVESIVKECCGLFEKIEADANEKLKKYNIKVSDCVKN